MKQRQRRLRSSSTSARAIGTVVLAASLTLAAGWLPASGVTSRTDTNGRIQAPVPATAVVAWNATASAALGTDAALPAPVMAVGMAYVQAAVYNAVIGINGGGPLYRWHVSRPGHASTNAAVAAAARGVLAAYFPVSATRVEAAYTTALSAIPEGRDKAAGIAFGQRAAAHLIAVRAGDGWLARVPYAPIIAPGIWRPTPPAFVPYLAPWLGKMKPFTLTSSHQFRPCAPPALRSARYARDLQEVQSVGSATSTTRTAEQTEIARFFAGNLSVQLQGGYRDHVVRHSLDAIQAARYIAVATLAGADAVISSWDSKLVFHNWRPVTAIQLADTDENPHTTPDISWAPLIVTPPFPEYLSGHTTVIGAVTAALERLDGTSVLDLDLSSPVTGTTRHYELGRTLRGEGIGARIWGGIHFRTSDEVGDSVGRSVGRWSARHFS